VIGSPVLAAMAPAPGQGQGALFVVVLQIAALIAIFYFLLIRPQRNQQKQHQTMLEALKKGDEVVTGGGIIGRIVHIKDDRVTIQSAESRLVIERARIARVIVPTATEEPAAK